MCSTALCMVAIVFGIDYGWQPLPDGGMEYIIQIQPHMLEDIEKGLDIGSDIPPELRGFRSYRITVGTGEVPREGEPPPVMDASEPDLETPPEADVDPPRIPEPLPDTSHIKPMQGQAAVFLEEPVGDPPSEAAPRRVEQSTEPEPSKPWLPLVLAMSGFCGSCGGMLYFGWIAWDYRRRYRAVLGRLTDTGGEQAGT